MLVEQEKRDDKKRAGKSAFKRSSRRGSNVEQAHNGDSLPKKRARRKPKLITPTYLANAALYYLQRYASSAAQLRTVLRRKVMRSARAHETDPAPGYQMIEELIVRYEGSGLLNDTAFAETKVRGLRYSGASTRKIQQKLQQKGVASDIVNDVIEKNDLVEDTDELQAAQTYARRKKLGPYRLRAKDNAEQKDLASMARAGFSYAIIKEIMNAEAMAGIDEA